MTWFNSVYSLKKTFLYLYRFRKCPSVRNLIRNLWHPIISLEDIMRRQLKELKRILRFIKRRKSKENIRLCFHTTYSATQQFLLQNPNFTNLISNTGHPDIYPLFHRWYVLNSYVTTNDIPYLKYLNGPTSPILASETVNNSVITAGQIQATHFNPLHTSGSLSIRLAAL